MPTLTNYVSPVSGPLNKGVWFFEPRVFVAAEDSAAALQTTLNTFLDNLATPLTDNLKYSLIDITHSSAQFSNNEIHYSALVHYREWKPF